MFVDCDVVLCALPFVRCHGVEIVSVNKPLHAMAMPFLTTGGNRVVYIHHWAWPMLMQVPFVAV